MKLPFTSEILRSWLPAAFILAVVIIALAYVVYRLTR